MQITLIGLLAALLMFSAPSPRLVYSYATCRDADTLLHFFAYGADGQSVENVHIEANGQPAILPALPKTFSGSDSMHVGALITGHPFDPVVTGGATINGQNVPLENPGPQLNTCVPVYVALLPVVVR